VIDLTLHAIGNLLAPVYMETALGDLEAVRTMIGGLQPRVMALRRALVAARAGAWATFDWWKRRVDPQHLTDSERDEEQPE
jgi:hypothetical protein